MFNQPSPPFIYFFLFRFLFTKFIYRNVGIAHCITVVASEWKKEKERERKFRGSHQTVLSDPNLFSLSDRNPIKLVPLDLPIMNAFSSPTRLRYVMQITVFHFSFLKKKKHCSLRRTSKFAKLFGIDAISK